MELFSPGHLIVIAVIALVLFFGWKQLPDMARSVGRSMRVFKTEIKGMSTDDDARQKADEQRAEPARIEPKAIEAPRARPRPTPSPNGARAQADRSAGSR